MLWISGFISIIFVFTTNFINKTDYSNLGGLHSWLTGSSIIFTNNWLKDGIVADKFTMLEKPYSIESQTLESRSPYVSYPNGTILITYSIAKMLGKDQIDVRFIKILDIVFYGLDALLIGFIVYLILRYLFKIKTRKGKIFISILLASVWIMLPNNMYYLKNVFFSDQLILFFTCLLVLLEILRNYAGITRSLTKNIINTLLFLTVLCGVLIDYYFWIQVFVLCIINFVDSFRQKKSFIYSLKNIAIYVIPSLLAVGIFFFQLIQINGSWLSLKNIMLTRTGHTQSPEGGGSFIRSAIGYIYNITWIKIYDVFGFLGSAFLYVSSIGSLLLLWYFKKKKQAAENLPNVFRLSLFIILPVYIQIFGLMNHSAVHEFSTLKLNILFVFGFLLLPYIIFVWKGKTLDLALELFCKIDTFHKKTVKNSYVALVTLFAAFFIFFNIYIYRHGIFSNYEIIKGFYSGRVAMEQSSYKMESLIKEMNNYENVFFSFTDSIPKNPPHSLAITKKMVYNVNNLDDINRIFPHLDNKAVVMLVVDRNYTEKSDTILKEEQYVTENFKYVKERNGYEIYSLNEKVTH